MNFLPCICGDLNTPVVEHEFSGTFVFCASYIPFEASCNNHAKIGDGETPEQAWNRVCLQAAGPLIKAAGFMKVSPIPQNDGVVRFKHSEIEKFRRLENCPPSWNTYAWEAFCDMALESLDIPRHHGMISTLMKENEKLRNALGDQYK